MNDILNKLYYGELCPSEKPAPQTKRCIENRAIICETEAKLIEQFPKCKDLLDTYSDALHVEAQTNTNLISAFKEISDTYNDISQGDYISKLMKSEHQLEAERRASAQERSEPKRNMSAPKPPVQDTTPKPEQHDSVPEKCEPKKDEPAQKPITKTTSRGLKH